MTGLTGRLVAHRDRLYQFADARLSAYIARRNAESARLRSKEFNDPIWGTLRARPAELVVLDSPLLQRLRQIRQLGVVHLVYPAAVHTRLEHSLGVAHQVQRLTESLEQDSAAAGGKVLREWHLPVLRLGAICHDIGHGVMSHVSENALDNDRECNDLILDFQDHVMKSRPNQLSEIAAYFLLGSPAFGALLTLADTLAPGDFKPLEPNQQQAKKIQSYQEKLQALVVSNVIDDEYPLLQELISGPFDADKLDYMPRDAAMCGVPVVTDVPRLIQKVRSQRVASDDLPPAIKKTVKQAPSYVLTGIARSGARTLDELALARALMFDKVYRHHKVRAAEAMVSAIFTELLAVESNEPAMLPFKLADEDLLSLTESTALAALGVVSEAADETQRAHLGNAVDIAQRLRERRLLVRGFAFSSKMPLDPYRNDPQQRTGLDALGRLSKDPEKRAVFVGKLVTRTSEICSALGRPVPETQIPGDSILPYVWFSPPAVSDGSGESNQIGHAWLIGQHGEPITRADQDYAETRGWSDAYVATRDLGLIFCPAEISTELFLAAESLVREEFEVRVPSTMLAFAKQEYATVDADRRALNALGWYDDKPADLRPEPEFFKIASTPDRIQAVVAAMQGYAGPLTVDPTTEKLRETALTAKRVELWLRQFPEDLVGAALAMLEHVRFIGRREVVETIGSFIAANPDFEQASIVAIGGPKDSSSVLTYYANDLQQEGLAARGLNDALLTSAPIIMIDDYIGRGSGVVTTLTDWLGAPDTEDLKQERLPALGDDGQKILKQKAIAVLFVAGKEEGRLHLIESVEALGITNLQAWIHDPALPSVRDDAIGLNEDVRTRLEQFLSEQGKKVRLEAGDEDATAASRALGYGGEGLLLVSSYNTPTATATALWQSGATWEALFPRRKKL